jgi:ribosomal protein S12 methylthiotransferase accessory factor YcaO
MLVGIHQRRDARWDSMMESIDLLFAKVADVDRVQQQMTTQLDISAQLMDQVLRDQQTLAKQMEITGQVVAQINLNRQQHDPEPHPARFREAPSPPPHTPQHDNSGHFRTGGDSSSHTRHTLPKMSFPKFTRVPYDLEG